MHKNATARGVWVDVPPPPPRKFLEFQGYEIHSETIFVLKGCFSEVRQQSFTCFSDEACEINHSLGRIERPRRDSFPLFAAISPCHHATCIAALSGYLPSMEEGKSGPVETGLTGLAATGKWKGWQPSEVEPRTPLA